MTPAPVLVVGIGSELRGDDGVGPAVARAVQQACDCGAAASVPVEVLVVADPLDLVDAGAGAPLAIVVDATRGGLDPGTVQVVELGGTSAVRPPSNLAGRVRPSSTHALGLVAALDLAKLLGHPPRRTVLVGVEGAEFGPGMGLGPAVADAVPEAVARVLELVAEVSPCA